MSEIVEPAPCLVDPRINCPLACGNSDLYEEFVGELTGFKGAKEAVILLRSRLALSPKQTARHITDTLFGFYDDHPVIGRCTIYLESSLNFNE